jgi:hypothetical protein
MPMLRTYAVFIISALTAQSISAGGSIYKWEDENGEIHYSQLPPADRAAERLGATSSAASPAHATGNPPNDRSRSAGDTGSDGEVPAGQGEQEPGGGDGKPNCDIARQNLANLEMAGNRRYRTPDGEVRHLSEEERQARIAEARTQIESNCPQLE